MQCCTTILFFDTFSNIILKVKPPIQETSSTGDSNYYRIKQNPSYTRFLIEQVIASTFAGGVGRDSVDQLLKHWIISLVGIEGDYRSTDLSPSLDVVSDWERRFKLGQNAYRTALVPHDERERGRGLSGRQTCDSCGLRTRDQCGLWTEISFKQIRTLIGLTLRCLIRCSSDRLWLCCDIQTQPVSW